MLTRMEGLALEALNPQCRLRAVRGLQIMNGAVFPTAPGVNQMISIEATAHVDTRALAAELN